MNVDVEVNAAMEIGGHNEDQNEAELTFKIEPILNEMLIKIESDINKFSSSLPTDPIYFSDSTTCSRFSSVNTCDSCASQDSVFWRRVARNKIVCNNCFFSQTYLLLFRETKEDTEASPLQVMDQDEQEQPIRKKTRASLKNIANTSNSKKFSTATSNLLNCLNDKVDIKNPASSASSTTSSCSNKTGPSSELKMELDLDEQMFHIPRKSTRFTSNKSKKNDNKSSGKNKKSTQQSSKCEETPNSDKASPIASPDLFPKSTDNTKVTAPSLKSRRTILFKSENAPPVKSQVLISTIFTSEFVLHRGFYMQVGDIVALYDEADPRENVPYFAQIRVFLTDQYGEKSAVLTWLIPIDSNYANAIRTPKDFNPELFILGPAEEYPRPLSCLEFVCRLLDYTNNKLRASEYINTSYQFKNDLQRHKFMLDDLADSNLKLMSTKYPTDDNQMEYEIKWG